MKGDEPESYIDDEGRFYKPLREGPRTKRELEFYAALFTPAERGQPGRHAAYPGLEPSAAGDGQDGAVASTAHAEPRPEDVEGLKQFVPRYFGTLEYGGVKLVIMEDLCRKYKRPCVLDCKMGFVTVYPWADEKYQAKNAGKDAETTSASVGFRVSGMHVYRGEGEQNFRPGRLWGKTLTEDNVGSAFELFAGRLRPRDLYGHPEHGALRQLRQLEAWAQGQASFQFFAASVLFMYEGEAACVEDAAVHVAWVDFAHTFRTLGGARDENLVRSLASMAAVVQGVVDRDVDQPSQ